MWHAIHLVIEHVHNVLVGIPSCSTACLASFTRTGVEAHAVHCREVIQTKNIGMNMQQSSVQVRYYPSDPLHTEEIECLPVDDTQPSL